MSQVSKTGPEAMRQGLNRRIRGSAPVAEVHHNRDAPNYRRNGGQRPYGTMRGRVSSVQHSHGIRQLLVFPHGVSHTRTGIDTRERGADQRQKYRRRLRQHEDPASSGPEQRIPHQNHQIPNGRGRARSIRQRVSIIKNVVRREIFKQIAETSLNQ